MHATKTGASVVTIFSAGRFLFGRVAVDSGGVKIVRPCAYNSGRYSSFD